MTDIEQQIFSLVEKHGPLLFPLEGKTVQYYLEEGELKHRLYHKPIQNEQLVFDLNLSSQQAFFPR